MSSRSDVPDAIDERCDVRHLRPGRIAELRRDLVANDAAGNLAETFRVLGDPTRVRMLDALSRGELCVCDLAGLIGLSESAVSHQLRLMRTLRLVRARRDGRMIYYSLDDSHIVALLRQGLHHVQEEQSQRLSTTAGSTVGRARRDPAPVASGPSPGTVREQRR